ncbi:hypothetical protein M3212_17430 [Alkalihalobacillus oceani]|uniref:hypothetical protein n=1 Tax=Halalkalibacter oceani TaxID=1653776 RepID=UPI0020415C9D|nr:hypothetical protein [Halalkalibacter oceani]MCM3762554.1 hypothetical protein [Halalkalibacter oceani]
MKKIFCFLILFIFIPSLVFANTEILEQEEVLIDKVSLEKLNKINGDVGEIVGNLEKIDQSPLEKKIY